MKVLPSTILSFAVKWCHQTEMCGSIFRSATHSQSFVARHLSGKRPYSSGTAIDATVHIQKPFLEIKSCSFPKPLRYHLFWLRDHCRCPACYNSTTYQRNVDLLDIPLDIGIKDHSLQGSHLDVTWSDGHNSSFDLKWLQSVSSGVRPSLNVSPSFWGAEMHKQLHKVTVQHSEYMADVDGVRQLVRILLKYGFALVTGVPVDPEATKAVAENLCPMYRTLFGEFWQFENKLKHQDSSYTNVALKAHTDNTYFNEPAGLLMLHCLKHTGAGGDTLLVDGFKAAETFKAKNIAGYDFLSQTPIPAEYMEKGQHHLTYETVFRHHKVTGKLQQIRFNLYDRAPLTILCPDFQGTFYSHLRDLANIISEPKRELWFKLNPGTVLFIDNWRVLHGRSTYTGDRVMCGCYLGRSDFLSKARILGLL